MIWLNLVCMLFLSINQLNAQQERPVFTWGNVAIGGGGFVSSIIADPLEQGLFYARTDVGGAYRWDEAAKKWVSMMDWVDVTERGLLGVEAIATDPKTPGKVYMVAGTSYWNDGRSAFLRSSDRGVNWEVIYTWDPAGAKGPAASNFWAHGNGMGRGNGEALAVDPNDPNIIFFGSRDKGLFRSTNNGNTWSKVTGFTTAAGSDTTWNGAGFSFVTFAPGSSSILYAGFLRSDNNVFQSVNGGTSWSVIPNRPKPQTSGGYTPPLMPQRIAIANDGSALYITFGNGAGPHTMQWDEGWGPINDWFNRGAVLKYNVTNSTWSDVSPDNYIGDNSDNPSEYIAVYGSITINPQNPLEVTAASIGYNQGQWWKVGSSWVDSWGTAIFHTTDGGENWVRTLPHYWPPNGACCVPRVEHLSENGIGWMFNSSIHWSGSLAADPFNPRRVWITSGNGVFMTEDIANYWEDPDNWDWETQKNAIISEVVWKVMSHGIEETVPYEVISIPNGPLISVILDYDGFRHDNITQYPSNRHQANISGTMASLGNTRGLAFAPKSGKLVKAVDALAYETTYNMPISPIQFSNDTGRTWTGAAHQTHGLNADNYKGVMSLAISTDGDVTLLTPLSIWNGTTDIDQPVRRYVNSAWGAVSGIDGAYIVGDPENANVFYAYNRKSGKMFKSSDKGITFSESSTPGSSSFYKFRLIPNKEGEIWIPLGDGGLTRSKDGGSAFNKISSVSYCEAIGFGKAAEGKAFPTIFIFGTVNGVTGVFMSIDEGENWWRVNDDKHEYGGLANGEFVVGDMNVYGRVYMSTAGRGIVYGEISGTTSSVRTKSKTAASAAVKIRGTAIRISAASTDVHHIQVFDLKGRQIYKRIVTGSASVSMNRILPKGNYLVSVKKNGASVYKSKMRIVK